MNTMPTGYNWFKADAYESKKYKCGFCGNQVSSEKAYRYGEHSDGSGVVHSTIYICPECKKPTFFLSNSIQIPNSAFGNPVENVPENINFLYEEARRCTSENCNTAAVLLCRKILMNIGVQQGGEENKKFIYYVEYLSNAGFVPPNGNAWVDYIRKKGNEANHEIIIMDPDDAQKLIIFIEMLLKFIYEFPRMIDNEEYVESE